MGKRKPAKKPIKVISPKERDAERIRQLLDENGFQADFKQCDKLRSIVGDLSPSDAALYEALKPHFEIDTKTVSANKPADPDISIDDI